MIRSTIIKTVIIINNSNSNEKKSINNNNVLLQEYWDELRASLSTCLRAVNCKYARVYPHVFRGTFQSRAK
jgi:hypothetical protein